MFGFTSPILICFANLGKTRWLACKATSSGVVVGLLCSGQERAEAPRREQCSVLADPRPPGVPCSLPREISPHITWN